MTASVTNFVDYTKPTTFSALFRQKCPPTSVDNCLYCNLLHPVHKNIVIIRGEVIELYNLIKNDEAEVKLNWLYSTPVYQKIADIVAVRFIGDTLDSLLISFPEAKVAVMNFDPITYELRTLSLHNYEFENLKSGRVQFTNLPILRVDPHQRCAVMLVYDRNLAVLPFRRTETITVDEANPKYSIVKPSLSWQQRATAPLLSTFTTCLSSSTGEKINNVIDMHFLHGFYEPTLLVLYEPTGTWAGDTCCIVALSLNLQKRTNPVIWFQECLPFDCHSVLPVLEPIGGVLILATNSIIYLKQTLPSCSLPLNCYAHSSTSFPMRQEVPSCGPLSLDGCHAVSLSSTEYLIGTRSGKLFLLTLWLEQTTQTVTGLLLHEAGWAVSSHCLAVLDHDCLFVGSRLCDSVLLKFSHSSLMVDSAGKEVNHLVEKLNELSEEEPPTKRDRLDVEENINGSETADNHVENKKETDASDNDKAVVVNGQETDNKIKEHEVSDKLTTNHYHYRFNEVDVELYGEHIMNPPSLYRTINNYEFEMIDRLINFAPIDKLTSGEVPCLAPGNTDPTDEALAVAQAEMHHVEMIGCLPRSFVQIPSTPTPKSNLASNGGILLLHTTVRPRGLTAFELPEYMSLWSLYGPPIQSSTDNDPSDPSKIGKPETDLSPNNNGTADEDCPAEQADTASVEACNDVNVNDDNDVNDDENIGDNNTRDTNQADTQIHYDTEQDIIQVDAKPINTPLVFTNHSYLLLTREDSTMILEVSHEIVELEVSGFNTIEMTVGAFNLGMEYIRDRTEISNNEVARVGTHYPFILQVSPTSLRLLDGPKLIEFVQITLEWRIFIASAADPYVLLCTEDDEFFLICLKKNREESATSTTSDDTDQLKSVSRLFTASLVDEVDEANDQNNKDISTPHLEITKPKVRQVCTPLCFTLYHDRGGRLAKWLWACKHVVSDSTLLMTEQSIPNQSTTWPIPDLHSAVSNPTESMAGIMDDEDFLLYGDSLPKCKLEHTSSDNQESKSTNKEYGSEHSSDSKIINDEVPSNYFAFIVFTNGVLEIYSLPDFTLLYEVHQFSDLPLMLFDHRFLDMDQFQNKQTNIPDQDDESIPPTILEIVVQSIGINKDRPILMARTSQEVAFFEAICYNADEAYPFLHGNLYEHRLRWRRLPIPCPLLTHKRLRMDPKLDDVQSTLVSRSNMMHSFDNINDHRGVFVCGNNPVWIFGTDSGQIRVFPHSIDGIIGSFASLNADICHSGFVYLTYSNEMRIATLPPGYSFKEPLGMKMIHLNFTPYFVQYHIESKTYVVVGVQSKPCKSFYRLNAEGNKEEELFIRPPTCALPTLDHYSLEIFAPNLNSANQSDWDSIPNTSIEFEPWEVVTCLITAQLASEQTFHGTKDYLALGANLSYGEEIPVRGRILIFDIIDVVPEPGQPLTRHKRKIIHDGEQKGPVTALASCNGQLVSAIGQKIYIWSLKNNDLVGVAFVDSEIYVHNLLCVKNLIIASDILKSIQLLRFQSDLRVLSVVSRDPKLREVYTSNFFVDGRRLGFLLTDEVGNLIIYSYDPLDPTSRSGRRLVRRADMCFPSRAICCLRVANRLSHPLLSLKASTNDQNVSNNGDSMQANTNTLWSDSNNPYQLATKQNQITSSSSADPERFRHSVYFCTQTGAIYQIGPIRDKMYSRLNITEKNLIHHLGPTCGVPPKLCWTYNPSQPELCNPCDRISDGYLIWRYLTLPHRQRVEIAKKSGQSLKSIMDDIAELVATTSHF